MRITVRHIEGRRFQATVDDYTVSVDSAVEYGEVGTAPSAPQLFAVAVAACIGEFVANSCRLHGIPFEHLSVEVEYEKHLQPRRIGTLEATLHIEPEPPEDVRRRLIGVARHVTLVNTLAHPPEVVIRFAESAFPALPASAAGRWVRSVRRAGQIAPGRGRGARRGGGQGECAPAPADRRCDRNERG